MHRCSLYLCYNPVSNFWIISLVKRVLVNAKLLYCFSSSSCCRYQKVLHPIRCRMCNLNSTKFPFYVISITNPYGLWYSDTLKKSAQHMQTLLVAVVEDGEKYKKWVGEVVPFGSGVDEFCRPSNQNQTQRSDAKKKRVRTKHHCKSKREPIILVYKIQISSNIISIESPRGTRWTGRLHSCRLRRKLCSSTFLKRLEEKSCRTT
jgi:hypothetical protein